MRFKIISYLLWTPTGCNHAGFSELIFPSDPSITALLWLLPLFGCRHFWFKTSPPSQLPPNMQPSTWVVSGQPCSHVRGKNGTESSSTGCYPQLSSTCASRRLRQAALDGLALHHVLRVLSGKADKAPFSFVRQKTVTGCCMSAVNISSVEMKEIYFLFSHIEKERRHI